MTDAVNRPKHYVSGGMEAIDAHRAMLTHEEFRGFLKGNVLKYLWREKFKGGDESLAKARWYLNELLKEYDKRQLEIRCGVDMHLAEQEFENEYADWLETLEASACPAYDEGADCG